MAAKNPKPDDSTATPTENDARRNRVPPEVRKLACRTGAVKVRRGETGLIIAYFDECVPTTFTGPLQRAEQFKLCNVHAVTVDGIPGDLAIHIKEQ